MCIFGVILSQQQTKFGKKVRTPVFFDDKDFQKIVFRLKAAVLRILKYVKNMVG